MEEQESIKKRLQGTKRGRGTSKQPVFGILGGYVWAEIILNAEAKTLSTLIQKKVKRGSTPYSDTRKSYAGIAAKGYVRRLVDHGQGEYSDRRGDHINGLEGFWGYLKRNLVSNGGIRREKLPLYLAEFVWRYNGRNLGVDERVDNLLTLLYNFSLKYIN